MLTSATAASRPAVRVPGLREPAVRIAWPPSAAAPIAPSVRRSCIGSRASGSARLTSGMTAMASASFTMPRTPGKRSAAAAAQVGLSARGDLQLALVGAHRGCPVRGSVDQQPVPQRHAAEPQFVLRNRAQS